MPARPSMTAAMDRPRFQQDLAMGRLVDLARKIAPLRRGSRKGLRQQRSGLRAFEIGKKGARIGRMHDAILIAMKHDRGGGRLSLAAGAAALRPRMAEMAVASDRIWP